MSKVRRSVVSRSVLQFHARPIHLHRQLAIPSVPSLVRRVKSNHVIRRSIPLDLRKRRRKIVVIQESLAARIRRQSRQRLLRSKVGIKTILNRRAVISSSPAQTPRGSISQRNRLQTTRIQAVNREIRPYRRIDRRPERSLVLNPVPRQATRKIQQRFLLIDLLQRLRNSPQRE